MSNLQKEYLIINGTPAQFGNMVKLFNRQFFDPAERDPYTVLDNQRNPRYSPDADPIIVELGRERLNHWEQKTEITFRVEFLPLGSIVAQRLPTTPATTNLAFSAATVSAGDEARQWWKKLLDEMRRQKVWLTDDPATDEKTSNMRGMNADTPARIRLLHDLLKSGKYSHRQAQKEVKVMLGKSIDLRTYYDRCKEVTGESAIYPVEK